LLTAVVTGPRRLLKLFVLSLLVTPLAGLAFDEGPSDQETRDPRAYFFIQTFGDLPEELQAAKQDGKQGMLLFFESESCSYCAFMLRRVFNQRDVQDWYRERFVSVAVDIHGDVEMTDFDGVTLPSKVFSDHRKVFLTPTVAFLNLRGEEIFRHTGLIRTPAEFLLLGNYIAEGRYDDIDFRLYAEQHGSHLEPGKATPGNVTDHRKDHREESP
jgi:thioredoxin-related protein